MGGRPCPPGPVLNTPGWGELELNPGLGGWVEEEGRSVDEKSDIGQLDGNTSINSEDVTRPDASQIPVQLGHRPAVPRQYPRTPVRRTVVRSNKLVDALSAPRISLYNVRSAWSKWDSIAEDIEMRETDLCFLTEVWEKAENRKHQGLVESMLEMRGIKYVSTPRPGARRGGGTALACNQEKFVLSKLNIQIPRPLEACFALLKPRNPTGKVTKFICCSFYAPPKSKHNNKLAEFLVVTVNNLRSQHPGARVILGADINDMKLGLLQSLDPTLTQTVRGFTNKHKDKTLDVLIMDCQELFQEPVIIPPMTVDEGKIGKDSDHSGVEARPRNNLAPEGSRMREKVVVQPFPESGMAEFGVKLMEEDWCSLEREGSSTDMVTQFEARSERLVSSQFPTKIVLVGPQDLPYFTEELRKLKRRRQRAFKKGKRSPQYMQAKENFEKRKVLEAIKYRKKIMNEVQEGKRNSGYKAIRKLGDQPGEGVKRAVVLPAFVEQGLSAQQSADRLADHFSKISQSVEPLNMNLFHPALRLALQEGKACRHKPVLTQHQVYVKMLKATKPKSSVSGDVPMKIIKQYTFEYAQPACMIFNRIIQSADWPRQWTVEQAIVLSKCKFNLPKNEDDLRTISKSQWLSKLMENVLGDFILPIVDKYIDPGQCGGLKNSSISHYLIKLLDFVHRTLDKRDPHCVVLSVQDLSKAYNFGSHQLVIEDLHSMHVPGWLLVLLCSYLTGSSLFLQKGSYKTVRSMILTYQKAKSSQRPLPGGFSAGSFLGGLFFIIKFNGACLRPPVPRPLTGNRTLQLKYIDDSSKAASINLKTSLIEDPEERARPFNFHERHQTILKPEEDILQEELDRFHNWTIDNKLRVNSAKCFLMQFSRSRKYDFPLDFTIGGSEILEEKKTMKILGIQIQADLKWEAQILQMVSRASKTSWVLRRMRALGVDLKTLVNYWKSEGRTHLEMACVVWSSSISLSQKKALERSQRVAMAAMTGHWAPSPTDQLAELGLELLASRRDQMCVKFARSTASKSRHQDIFTVASSNAGRPGKDSKQYLEPRARTEAYRRSAVPYLTRILNDV